MKTNHLAGHGALAMAGFCLLLGSVASAKPVGKIEICHKPGQRAQKILVIAPGSVADHEGHGDYVVEPEVCDGLDSDCEKPPVADNDVDCSDGIECTIDQCAGAPGCFNMPDDAECDDGDPNTLDECSLTAGGCVNTPIAFCGDGVINQAEEQCDDGNNDDGDGCSASCEIEVVACPCFADVAALAAQALHEPPPACQCAVDQPGGVCIDFFDNETLTTVISDNTLTSGYCSTTAGNNVLVTAATSRRITACDTSAVTYQCTAGQGFPAGGTFTALAITAEEHAACRAIIIAAQAQLGCINGP